MNAKKILKITAVALACVIGLTALLIGGYVAYVAIQYYRIDDNVTLEVVDSKSRTVEAGMEYSVMTYNAGFGAYSPEYSFFMDTGVMADSGKQVTGKYAKGMDKADVRKNVDGQISEFRKADPDFCFLQEVDETADRSYRINMKEEFISSAQEYGATYAENFHTANLFYPFNDPMGITNAGILTLSKYNIESAARRSFPLTVRAKQLEMLNRVLAEEYSKGNYVIAGGDFNHCLIADKFASDAEALSHFKSKQLVPEWVKNSVLHSSELAEGFTICADADEATCRGADIPYEKGVNYVNTIDGFIVSANVRAVSVKTVPTEYAYSDHNPVILKFALI